MALCGLTARKALAEERTPPYIETPPRVIERMLTLAKIRADDTLIDLGSGDGRIVIHAAKRYGTHGLGVELVGNLVELSRRNAEREGVQDRARFVQQDALRTDLSGASVLTLYLLPELNERLMPRILQTMRPGSRVVAHDFGIGTWTPDVLERMDVPEKNRGKGGESIVMMWVVPANALGRWRAQLGSGAAARTVELSIGQQFQFIEAAAHTASGPRRLAAAKLSGERIELSVAPASGIDAFPREGGTVLARIEADMMHGTLHAGTQGATAIPFSARRVGARPDPF